MTPVPSMTPSSVNSHKCPPGFILGDTISTRTIGIDVEPTSYCYSVGGGVCPVGSSSIGNVYGQGFCTVNSGTEHLPGYNPQDCYTSGSCRNDSACAYNSDCKYSVCQNNKCVETDCQKTNSCTKTIKFKNNTTWTVPPGVTSLGVLVVGGGGGGGGAAMAYTGGSGGSGGQVIENNSYAVTPGQTIQVTVGGGGNGGHGENVNWNNMSWNTRTDGNAGGASAFGSISAQGGAGGGSGGAGGTGGAGTPSSITGASMMYGMGSSGGHQQSGNGFNHNMDYILIPGSGGDGGNITQNNGGESGISGVAGIVIISSPNLP